MPIPYDPYLDMSLPPPSLGGNEPTTAPFAPPGQELGWPSPSPSPSSTPFPDQQWNIPPNPFQNYDPYGSLQVGSDVAPNPDAGQMNPYDPNYDYGNPVPSLVSSGVGAGLPEPPGLSNIPGVTFNAEGSGPSDVGNGPLYYDPVTKSWVQRAASTVAGVPGSVARGIAGIPGSIGNAARGLGRGIRTAIETPGWSSPDYLRSQGYREGAGTGSLWPGAGPTVGSRDIGAFGAGDEGGSFFHANPHRGGGRFYPLPGTPGIFGRGAVAASERVPFWDREMMRQAHMMRRGYVPPPISSGDAVSQFAASLGSHPRYQGAYSPAARAAALASPLYGGGSAMQFAPPPSEGVGPASGPNQGIPMSPV